MARREGNSHLSQADDAGANPLAPVFGQEGQRCACLSGLMFPDQVDQEGGVRNHLRPPERRPRSLSMRSSTSRLTFGEGVRSMASSNSPQVSAGRLTCRRKTLVNESPGPCFNPSNSL